jgi:hypothetical protein
MAKSGQDIERLYGLRLEEFTPARDRMAIELREQGDREAAAGVKKLRKPSVPAWAVNQLVRKHSKKMQELLKVGEEVRSALSGGKPADVRRITDRRRKTVDQLLDLAEDILVQAGHAASRPTLDKVGDTLMAATMDEAAADALRAGRLERELAPQSGFEALVGQMPALTEARSRREEQTREKAKRTADQANRAKEAAKTAEREARRLADEAERLQRDADRAHRRAIRAAEQASELRRKAESLTKDRKT